MSNLEKLKTLRDMYTRRSYGFGYYDEPVSVDAVQLSSVPNTLGELHQNVMRCALCGLCKTRKNVVFGEGDPHAELMFVGEGPGASEDATGRPFVGQAGQLLTQMIEAPKSLGMRRSDVYIANIVKCRPPNNRVPTPDEAEVCKPYLMKQIEIIRPKLIVALGATAYRYLTGDETPISKVRGEVIPYGDAKLLPTFHPSFLLRNPSAKVDVWHDMLKIKGLL
jgi:DNA polymerase